MLHPASDREATDDHHRPTSAGLFEYRIGPASPPPATIPVVEFFHGPDAIEMCSPR